MVLSASGASRFNAAASTAETKLARERATLESVRQTLATLDAARSKERAASEALAELRALTARERAASGRQREEVGRLCGALKAERDELSREIAAAGEEARQEAGGASLELASIDSDKAQSEARLKEASAALSAARRSVTAARDSGLASEAAAVDAVVQREVCEAELRSLLEESGRAGAECHATAVAISRLRGELAVAQRAQQEAAAGERGSSSPAVTAADADEARGRHEVAAAAAREADGWLSQLLAQQRGATTELSRQREASASAKRTAESASAAERDNATSREVAVEVRRSALAEAEARLATAEEKAHAARNRLAQYAPAGCETLCSAVALAEEEPRLEGCLAALHCIASHHLGVRLVDTAAEALPLLDEARRRGGQVRVWPLDRLRSRDHSAEHAALSARFGARVVAPRELLRFPERVAPAVRQALGGHVIVDSDATAAQVIACSTLPCVTTDGTVHERGRVSGGHRGESRSFRLMLEQQLASEAARQASVGAAAAREALTSLEEALAAEARASSSEEWAVRRLAQLDGLVEASRFACLAQHERAAEAAALSDRARAAAASNPSGGRAGREPQDRALAARARAEEIEGRLRAAEQRQVELQSAGPLVLAEDEAAELRLSSEGHASALAASLRDLERHEHAEAEAAEEVASASGAVLACRAALEAMQARRRQVGREAHAAEAAARSRALVLESRREAAGAALAEGLSFAAEAAEASDDSCGSEGEGEDAGVGEGDNDPNEDAAELMEVEPSQNADGTNGAGSSAAGAKHGSKSGPGNGGGAAARLRRLLDHSRAEARTRQRRRAEIERQHGSRASLRKRLHGTASSRLARLEECKRKEAVTAASIENLLSGIEQMRGRVQRANAAAFAKIRDKTRLIFAEAVPAMEVDMVCADPANPEASGVRFLIRSRAAAVSEPAEAGEGGEAAGGWRSGLEELSGGQRTLLKLSLLLAVAHHRPSLFILLDEVDAALDEANTIRVASLIKELSRTTQVVAVSHRAQFMRFADHIVRLSKAGDMTVVG